MGKRPDSRTSSPSAGDLLSSGGGMPGGDEALARFAPT
jgi:hypothetical protein